MCGDRCVCMHVHFHVWWVGMYVWGQVCVCVCALPCVVGRYVCVGTSVCVGECLCAHQATEVMSTVATCTYGE